LQHFQIVHYLTRFLFIYFTAEITTLFAPAVSDDEDGGSRKGIANSDSPVQVVDMDDISHPGAQVAATAAAIDSALQVVKQSSVNAASTPIAPRLQDNINCNKRPYDVAMPEQNRQVSVDDHAKRITLSSSCGSLVSSSSANSESFPNIPNFVSVPSSPSSVPGPTVATSAATAFVKTATSGPPAKKAKKATAKTGLLATALPKPSTTASIRQGMTAEEKAAACRERNREHARKTRLRKKAYVDELKRNLNELVEQRDATQAKEEHNAKIMEQNRDVRFQVMQDFLNLRGNNERSVQRWSAILVPEEFTLKMPSTDFQTMISPSVYDTSGQQLLTGVEDVMADANYFSLFLQTLGTDANESCLPVYFAYSCQRETFLMDGSQATFNFEATTTGATNLGAKAELVISGTFRANFCTETNRLRSAQMMFDTGAIHTQLASN